MFFSMDDFDKDNEYYEKGFGGIDDIDDSSFIETLMVLSSIMKSTNFTSEIKDSAHFMMKIFNVSQLDVEEENEPALNLIIGLIMHVYALMQHVNNKDEYFNYIDQTIIAPLMEEG